MDVAAFPLMHYVQLLEEYEMVRRTAQEALDEARAAKTEGESLSQGQADLAGAEIEDKLRALQVGEPRDAHVITRD